MSGFDPELVELLHRTKVVEIETSRSAGGEVRSTVIWVVVDVDGRALVRSVRGQRGRWYRDLLANPDGALRVGRRRIPVHADPADEGAIAACTDALRAKYASSRGSLASMIRDEVLRTTLVLAPA